MTSDQSANAPKDHPTYEQLLDFLSVWAGWDRAEPPSDEDVDEKAKQLATLIDGGVPPEVHAAVVREMLTRMETTVERGLAVVKDRNPWIESLRSDKANDWAFWDAYRKLIRKAGRGNEPLQELTRAVEDILDLAGDPRVEGAWQRRGLVMGDVQSGKTSNFIGLMNMAADAGYRLFIVIGGHTEDLRVQTQKRVDEGFIGRRSLDAGTRGQHEGPRLGVGTYAERSDYSVISVTTEESDFGKRAQASVNFGDLGSTVKAPLVLVVKKHSGILNKLTAWLRSMAGSQEVLSMPMMVIDDEADYASVNTNKKEKAEATAVNEAIIKLLSSSQRATYVGFTATPFANILIDPDPEEDLFPRDYIYSLMAPSDYMGAIEYFGEDTGNLYSRTNVGDAEGYFPFGHKRDLHVPGLPESLKRAVDVFILASTITDLRQGRGDARSMLVNVSRFNDVQYQVERLINAYVGKLENVVQFTDVDQLIAGEGAEPIQRLHQAWQAEYLGSEFTWADVVSQLRGSLEIVETELINLTTDKERKRRAERRSRARNVRGRRVIAVGGTILSRGLTLDGLVTSYFYQRTQLSDTLMQMGRWFGYRKGYEDLVRVWIDADVRDWFLFAARSLEEIREDIKLMEATDATPQEFGLKILQHPESLKITAANKMRHSEKATLSMTFAQQSLETKTASLDKSAWATNRQALADLMAACEQQSQDSTMLAYEGDSNGHIGYAQIDRTFVEYFLDTFVPGRKDTNFSRPRGDASLVSNYVREQTDLHGDLWDVAVIVGSGGWAEIPGLGVKRPSNRRDTATIRGGSNPYFSFASRRVASEKNLADIAKGLRNGPDTRWRQASGDDGSVLERMIPRVIDRPILMIYPISWIKGEGHPPIDPGEGLLGLKVTFPAARDNRGQIVEIKGKTQYRVNRVWLEEAGLLQDVDAEVGDDV